MTQDAKSEPLTYSFDEGYDGPQGTAQVDNLKAAAEALLSSIDKLDPEQSRCSTVAYMNLRAALNNINY